MRRRRKEKIIQKSSQNGLGVEKLSDPIYIPSDLTVDILSTLPLKSLVRFQCVSKLWSSLITDSIKTRYLTQPCLLVLFHHRMFQSSHFWSSTYPLNPTKTFISADKECPLTLACGCNYGFMYRYVHGLICCLSRSDKFAIYNPTTRQSFVLPGIDTFSNSMEGFFGYDPVENQYKVVLCCIDMELYQQSFCHVFTLGTRKKQKWRYINTLNNFARPEGFGRAKTTSVCINGIIYYTGWSLGYVLGRFNVRFERFDHIQLPMKKILKLTLVNYQGKLGCVSHSFRDRTAEMWILEDDIEKQEWSKIELSMPPDLLRNLHFQWWCIAGVSRNGEIVIMPESLDDPAETLYAYFLDPKQKETRRVELEITLKETLKYQMEFCIFSEPDHMETTMDFKKKRARRRRVNKKRARRRLNKKKLVTRRHFLKKQLMVIAFFCATLLWLVATTFRTEIMSLLDSFH